MPNGTATIRPEEHVAEHRHTIEAIFGGSMVSGLVAAGAATLAIIALAGLYPQMLVDVATIGIGAALIFEGASIVARFADLLREVTEGKVDILELGTGTTGETLAGLVGVALGILAIVGIVPAILVPCAGIVFGAALVLGAGANVRINELRMAYRHEHPIVHRVMREAVRGATGLQVLAGLGAITLGILALAGMEPLILSLVTMLGISGVLLLTDTAVAGRMWSIFPHHQ